jgi:cobalt transporter subunit CbtB
MKTQTQAAVKPQSRVNTNVIAIVFAAFVGLTLVTIAGHVQATALHDAAHDVRHATGFPCH